MTILRLALGWAILHSLWQGALSAVMLACALSVIRGARARYAVACFGMLAILCGFVLTFSHAIDTTGSSGPAALRRIPAPPFDRWDLPHSGRSSMNLRAILPWIAPFWFTGVVLFHLHSLASWLAAHRMLRRGVCRAPDVWRDRFAKLRDRVHLSTAVALLESCLTEVPVVIGYLRPAVLVPVGLLAGMPAAHVEAILLHELAHIRRRDYLVNLLQTVAENLLFYHPAVWWISGVIRAEREHCCDDLVVALSGDAHQYASALAALEETRWAALEFREPDNDAVLAATGGNLMNRIRRLLNPLDAPRAVFSPALSAAILTLTAAVVLMAWQTNTVQPDNPYQRWLKEDVAYIITDAERTAYKNLQSDPEREKFIEQFWSRRDPTPDTPENEFKEEHYRRIAFANDHFWANSLPGWKTDRGRMYIMYGPANEIDSHPAGGVYHRPPKDGGDEVRTYPFELWKYRFIEGVGENVIIEFVDPESTHEFHMTYDPNR